MDLHESLQGHAKSHGAVAIAYITDCIYYRCDLGQPRERCRYIHVCEYRARDTGSSLTTQTSKLVCGGVGALPSRETPVHFPLLLHASNPRKITRASSCQTKMLYPACVFSGYSVCSQFGVLVSACVPGEIYHSCMETSSITNAIEAHQIHQLPSIIPLHSAMSTREQHALSVKVVLVAASWFVQHRHHRRNGGANPALTRKSAARPCKTLQEERKHYKGPKSNARPSPVCFPPRNRGLGEDAGARGALKEVEGLRQNPRAISMLPSWVCWGNLEREVCCECCRMNMLE